MQKLRVLDLFSGIGGFSLGLERTGGFETVAFCEIEPFPRKVLKKHWPHVPCYEDVRTLTAERLAADGISVDVICGGFPCQDISLAGKGAGLDGKRSGLWSQIARLAGEIQPTHLFLENVSALLDRGIDRVLGDLAEIGYDAEWHCIPASAIGAPHGRDRVWILAYPDSDRCGRDARGFSQAQGSYLSQSYLERFAATLNQHWPQRPGQVSEIQRGAYGVPGRSHGARNRALGNAVVPQIPELIGRAILDAMEAS